jgi:hypothetical protein
MKRLACVCACVLFTTGFAPVPSKKTEVNPDKAIAQFEKDVKDKDSDAVAQRKKKLIEHLKKLEAHLIKAGKKDKAEAIRERLLLIDTLGADNRLGKVTVAELLKKAGNGKYKHLLRVLLLPGDQASYNQFTDFGYWSGTAYGGATDLPLGYWVYVYPRWFIWRDGPPRP